MNAIYIKDINNYKMSNYTYLLHSDASISKIILNTYTNVKLKTLERNRNEIER